MLEKMGDFFDRRLDGYEDHQLNCIDKAKIFYTQTAKELPENADSNILDLGCGTGLELNEFFKRNPKASVTGIDLASAMLKALKAKFSDKKLHLINGSYFDVPFGKELFDAAVSCESLHHFTLDAKIPLYKKLCDSLKVGGYFILTDYIIDSDDEEKRNFLEFAHLKKEQNIKDGEFYHFDTPLTKEHEKEALIAGGFSKVILLKDYGNTKMFKAVK